MKYVALHTSAGMAGCSTGPPGWGWEVGWGALDIRSSNSDAYVVLMVVNM